jgi:type I restriction enzyme S subunit
MLTDSGPFVVRSQDVRSGVFRVDEAAHVSEETYRDRIARAEPSFGDLVYSREGTYFGIAAEVPQDTRVCLGQRMVLIRPNPRFLNHRFLRFWLNSPVLARHIHGFRDGTVAERLNMPTIRGLPIPIFDHNEQEAIVEILGAIDDKIEVNRRTSETLDAAAQSIFKDWFVDFGPTRAKAEGQESYLASEIWDIFPRSLNDEDSPEGWPLRKLGDFISVIKGRSYRSSELQASGVALVTLKSFRRGGGYREDGLKAFTGSFDSEQIVKSGELIVALTDVTQAADVIGKPAIVSATSDYETLVASLDVGIVRPKQLVLGISYLYCLLRTPGFVNHIYGHCTGTTVLHLAKEGLPTYEFPLPPERLCGHFHRLVEPMFSKIAANNEEERTLIKTRDLFLPRLISGEICFRDAEKAAQAVV